MATTLRNQRRLVEQNRQRRFEDFRQWEYESRRRDELADAAERVRAPMANTQEFTLTPEGLVNDLGQELRQIIVDGLAEARFMAATNPDWEVEVERCEIDLEEYDAFVELARRGSGALVSYWMIPDAVRQGSSLPGYNRERNKMFDRIAVATPRGVAIRYRSFDGSDPDGVRAMDQAIGYQFAPGRGSEQIARERRPLDDYTGSLDELDEVLRDAYDTTMSAKYGGEWYGGRRAVNLVEAISFIEQPEQNDLIAEHMSIVAKIFALTNDHRERNRLMEPHRYNFAAALDDRMYGKEVASVGQAGADARAEGRNYDGDCPTGSGPATANEQMASVGFNRRINSLNCVKCPLPNCGKIVDAKRTSKGGIYCPACRREARGGEIIDHTKRQSVARNMGRSALQSRPAARPASQRARAGETFTANGRTFRYEQTVAVGGTARYTVDAATGQKVADGWQ